MKLFCPLPTATISPGKKKCICSDNVLKSSWLNAYFIGRSVTGCFTMEERDQTRNQERQKSSLGLLRGV